MKLFIQILMFTFSTLCLAGGDAIRVTPQDLNKNPETYDGKYVFIAGYILNEFENHAIWQESDSDKRNAKNCISVLYHSDASRKLKKINRKHVVIGGIFSKNIFSDGKFIAMGSCNRTAITVDVIEIDAKR